MRISVTAMLLLLVTKIAAQNIMTPELLWKLGRVSGIGITKDKKYIIYSVSTPDVASNKSSSKTYQIPVGGGVAELLSDDTNLLADKNVSPDGKYILSNRRVKINKVLGKDIYPDLDKSNVYVYEDLMYRHWDEWSDGTFDHVFYAPVNNKAKTKDIMPGEPYHAPTKPFGGDEDYTWSPDSKNIVYVSKKKFGKDYAVSTNSDIYSYNIETGATKNLSEGMMGYDLNPAYSSKGALAWLSMKRDGYEADKQDIVVLEKGNYMNLTAHRDDLHVTSFKWS